MKHAATGSHDLAQAVLEFEKNLLVFSHTHPDWNSDPALYPHLMELKQAVDLLRHTLWFHISRLPQPIQEKRTLRSGPQSFIERIDGMIIPQLTPDNEEEDSFAA